MSATSHFSDIYLTINEALRSHLTLRGVTIPVINDFDDGEGLDLSNGFIYLSVDYTTSGSAAANRIGAASRYIRTQGIIYAQLNLPKVAATTGVKTALDTAGIIAESLRNREIVVSSTNKPISCFTPTIELTEKMRYGQGEFWATPIVCPFRYDEVMAVL